VTWLSVVIPTHNGEAYLGAALRSIVDQGRTDDIEVVLVDDASTDATVDVAASFDASLPLRVVRKPTCTGWPHTTNIGAREARGRSLSVLHQDDLWLPGRLAWLRTQLGPEGVHDVAISPAEFVDHEGRSIGRWPLPGVRDSGARSIRRLLAGLTVQNNVCVAAPAIPRARYLELGGIDEDLWYTGDWKLWLQAFTDAAITVAPGPTVAFRLHADAQTTSRTSDTAEVLEQYERLFARVPAIVRERSRVTVAVNLLLLALYHRRTPPVRALASAFLRGGAIGWVHWARYSGTFPRALARVRCRWR
jgi:glycosyltransferase involved in cell wall biosynthesis